MKVIYYGHALRVEIKGKHLLFDPFITNNDLAKHIDIEIDKDVITKAFEDSEKKLILPEIGKEWSIL